MIRVTTDVFCDDCGNWVHGGVSNEKDATSARRIARELGWVVRRRPGRMVDICPGCQKGEKSGDGPVT